MRAFLSWALGRTQLSDVVVHTFLVGSSIPPSTAQVAPPSKACISSIRAIGAAPALYGSRSSQLHAWLYANPAAEVVKFQ